MKRVRSPRRGALRNLAKVARIKSELELARLGMLTEQKQNTRGLIAGVRAKLTSARSETDLSFLLLGAAAAERWGEAKLRDLAETDANIASEIEKQRIIARNAYGKAFVIEKMLKS